MSDLIEQKIAKIKERMCEEFDLGNQAIIFNIITFSDYGLRVGTGIIDCSGDLYDEDCVFDVGYDVPDDETLDVDLVESFMLGNGEADHIGCDECQFIEELLEQYPFEFQLYLEREAELLTSINHVRIDNPAYEPDMDDEDEEEEW